MKRSQSPWKWLLFGLLAVLLPSIALLPMLVGDTSRFGDRVAAELSAWTGGKVEFTGPVRVSLFPDVSVRGELKMRDSARLPLVESFEVKEAKVSLDLIDLLRGRITIDALRLLKPRITLRNQAAPAVVAAGMPEAQISKLLAAAPVRALHVRKARIRLGKAYGGSIKDIYAHLDVGEETGAVSGFGSFTFKGTTVRYALEGGSPNKTETAESVPISLTLSSKPFKAKISGTASMASAFKLDGDMQAETDDLRKFLKWVGIALPEGESLKRFTASGSFHLSGPTLTFDDGTFVLDGNKAIGLLAVTLAPARPRLEATLAFGRLVLDPYLGPSEAPADATGPPRPSQTTLLDGALLNYFDADLRISAAEIAAGRLKLGRGGFTVTAKDGVVSGDVGELELCGGSADGRIGVDVTQTPRQLDLVANLADISLDTCLNPLELKVPIKGTGNLKAELSSRGIDLDDLTQNLNGTLTLAARDGAVPVDFARLLAATPPLDGSGWSGDSGSSFSQLDADCQVAAGQIRCQSLNLRTPRGSVSGTGSVDLPKKTLDWSLSVANDIDEAKASHLTQQTTPEISIRGSLLQPVIRRADRPTLGEGSPRAAPMAPQALPH
ncbi:MAG: AsmA family protein [Methyloceanibacter sp.]